jgi:hypothetical protein
MRRAGEIIEQSWLEAGMTPEEMARDKQIADLFQRLLAEGWQADDLLNAWQNKSAEEILREYAPRTEKVAALFSYQRT